MDMFVDGSLAVVYILIGLLLGGVMRRETFTLRAAPQEPTPPPPPAPEPERSPDWCHSHGTHKDNEK